MYKDNRGWHPCLFEDDIEKILMHIGLGKVLRFWEYLVNVRSGMLFYSLVVESIKFSEFDEIKYVVLTYRRILVRG